MLKSLSISWQLRLVVALCLIPVLLLAKLFVDQSFKDINFAEKERDGVVYLRAVWPVYTATLLNDPGTAKGNDVAAAAVKALESVGSQLDADMQSAEQSAALRDAFGKWAAASGSNAETLRLETRDAALALMARVGDKSNLILDPDLDTYYLMDVVLMRLPNMVKAVSAVERANRALTGDASFEDRLGYLSLETSFMDSHAAVGTSVTAAYDGNADGSLKAGSFPDSVAQFDKAFVAIDELADASRDAAMSGGAPPRPAGDFTAEAVTFEASANALWLTSADELDRLLVARIDGFKTRMYLNLGIVVAALAIALAASYWIASQLSGAIATLVDRLKRLTANDTALDIPYADRSNEIGAIASGLALFKQSIHEREALAAQVEADRRAAQQELEQTVANIRQENADLAVATQADQLASRKREQQAILTLAGELEASVASSVGALSASATQLNASAAQMSATSTITLEQAQIAGHSSRMAEDGLSAIAPTVEQMTSSIREISGQVNTAARVASEAVERVAIADKTVDSLAETAGKIGEIVTLINAIAEQTNLLALNATIEAARAGEAGKGFAVVASEVKSLATQTASATREIAEQIGAIQGSTQTAVNAIRDINKTVEQVSTVSSMIAAAIEEQTAAIGEINRSIGETASGARGVVTSIAEVDRAAVETQSASSEVVCASHEVSQQAENLREKVSLFIDGLRRAQAA
jgi:methyl-accepting chemotaxis protein